MTSTNQKNNKKLSTGVPFGSIYVLPAPYRVEDNADVTTRIFLDQNGDPIVRESTSRWDGTVFVGKVNAEGILHGESEEHVLVIGTSKSDYQLVERAHWNAGKLHGKMEYFPEDVHKPICKEFYDNGKLSQDSPSIAVVPASRSLAKLAS